MSKNIYNKAIQALISLVLLSVVAYQVGLFEQQGRQQFIDLLLQADLTWLVISIIIGLLVTASSAFKWFCLVKAQKVVVGYWRLFAYYLVGQFYNLFLPTSVGGDVMRSYELGKYSGHQARALASVFVERYTGVLVLLALAVFAVLARLSTFALNYVVACLVIFTVGLGLMAWVIFDRRIYNKVHQGVISKWPVTEKLFSKLEKLLVSINEYRDQPSAIAVAFLNSLVFYFLAVVNVYVTALVFEHQISFQDMLIATPIIMLIMNLPISIGNFGLMEFGYASIFQLMGYEPVLGLSVALLMRLKSLFDGALGGVLHPFYIIRSDTDSAVQKAP